VVRVAAVNDDVAALEVRHEVGNGLVYDGRRDHQPDRPRLLQLADEVGKRGGRDRLLQCQIFDRLRRHVEHHALMAAFDESPHHIGAHPPQSDHRKLKVMLPPQRRAAARSRSMAVVTRSLSLKIADPATKTLAPAAATSGAVATSIPPSTSSSHPGLIRSISWRARPIFGSV